MPAAAAAGAGRGGGERQFGEAVGDGFELQQRREHDVHVRIPAAGFMDRRHALGRQNNHGDGLRDRRLPIGRKIPEEVILIVGSGRDGDVLLGGDQGNAGGESVVDYGEGEVWDVILFRQTDRRRGAGEGGAKGTLERGERNLEVDGVGGRSGFDGVIFKDRVLWRT